MRSRPSGAHATPGTMSNRTEHVIYEETSDTRMVASVTAPLLEQPVTNADPVRACLTYGLAVCGYAWPVYAMLQCEDVPLTTQSWMPTVVPSLRSPVL